jgi:PAS domain S-box-containing protein
MGKEQMRVVLAGTEWATMHRVTAILSADTHIRLVGETTDQHEAERLVAAARPAVAVVVPHVAGNRATDAVRATRRAAPDTPVLVLAADSEPAAVLGVFAAGARGFLPPSASGPEIVDAVRRVGSGLPVLPAGLGLACIRGLCRALGDARRVAARFDTAERALRAVLDGVPVATVMLGQAGRVEYANAEAARLLGGPVGRFHDLPLGALLEIGNAGDLHGGVTSADLGAEMTSESGRRGVLTFARHEAGHLVPVLVRSVGLRRDRSSHAVFLVKATRRSADQAWTERALEHAPEATMVVDRRGRIAYGNHAARQMFGYRRDQLSDRPIAELLPHVPVAAACMVEDALTAPHTVIRSTGRRQRGEELTVDVAVRPVNHGQPFSVVVSVRPSAEGSNSAPSPQQGDSRPESDQGLHHVSGLMLAMEQERARIAAGIHDDTLQVITAATLRLQQLRRRLQDPGDRAVLDKLEETIALAADRLRKLIFQFRPPGLERESLAAALREYMVQMSDDGAPVLRIRDQTRGEPLPETRMLIYRIAEEALANVIKHAQATTVDIRLSELDGGYLVQIEDDGVGFQPRKARAEPGHLGLLLMAERAESAGGWYRIDSASGRGTRVEFWVPAPHRSGWVTQAEPEGGES